MTTATAPAPPLVPYRGIEPFRLVDRAIFFARAEDARQLLRYVTIYRGVLFYGDSGAGKSSLINAGFIPAARDQHFAPERLRVRPRRGEELVVERIPVDGDADGPGVRYLPSAFVEDDDDSPHVVLSLESFEEKLRAQPADRRTILIFDQFEEYVTLFEETRRGKALQQSTEVQDAISALLLSLLRDQSLPIKLLFVFREDYLAKLAKLLARYPDLRDQYQRLQPLRTDALEDIIRGPFRELPGRFGVEISPELARDMKKEIEARGEGETLNLTEVQIACLELWKSQNPETVFREKHIQGLLEGYLSAVLDGFPEDLREPAVSLLSRMVTSAGTRNVVSKDDLLRTTPDADGASCERFEEALTALEVEAKLVQREIRHNVDYYQIVSEFLIPWISEQKTRRQQQAEERRLREEIGQRAAALRAEEDRRREAERANRRLRHRLYLAVGFAALMVIATGMALYEYLRADAALTKVDRQAHVLAMTARSRHLAAQALRAVPDRLDLGLLLGVSANDAAVTAESETSLLTALMASPRLTAFVHSGVKQATTVAVSPDGTTIAVAGCAEPNDYGCVSASLHLRTLKTGDEVAAPATDGLTDIKAIAYSPDGTVLAAAGRDGLVLWNPADGRRRPLAQGDPSAVCHGTDFDSVAVSPDSATVATGGNDGCIILWDVGTGHPRLWQRGHTQAVTSLVFSQDRRWFASGSADGTVILWDAASGQTVQSPLATHGAGVTGVAFNHDSTLLASGGRDGRVLLSGVAGQPPDAVPVLENQTGAVLSVAFSPVADVLAAGGADKTVTLWDLTKGQTPDRLTGHTGRFVPGLAFSPDGGTLVSVDQDLLDPGQDSTIILWDATGRQSLGRTIGELAGGTTSVAVDADGSLLALGARGGLTLWDRDGQPREPQLQGAIGPIYGVAFNPKKALLAAGGADGATLWDLSSGTPLSTLPTAPGSRVLGVAFSPDGQQLATGASDGTIAIWDVPAGGTPAEQAPTPTQELPRANWQVTSVAFSPDGERLAAGEADGTVFLWDVAKDRAHAIQPAGHHGVVTSVAFSPDGTLLASGGADGMVLVWDVAAGAQGGAPLVGHQGAVQSVAFSPDGKLLASAGQDGKILLWDVASQLALEPPLGGGANVGWQVAFRPDGQVLVSAGSDGAVVLWDVGLASWRNRACHIANRDLTPDEWERFGGDESYHQPCAPANTGDQPATATARSVAMDG
jgi:WD40 repeat protein